jgi:hypothetical protein
MFYAPLTRTLNDMRFARFFPAVEALKPRAALSRGSLGKVAARAALVVVVLLASGIEMADVAASAGIVDPRVTLRPAQVVALDNLVASRLNVIRASFGLAAGQATTAYRVEVTAAVIGNEDPPFAPLIGGVVAEGSLWGVVSGAPGSSASSALEIVNGWVYHDGWEGSRQATWNADCTSARAVGCDGHRRNVLTTSAVPGAKLYIDVTTRGVSFDGSPALAVAALFVWKTGSTTT